MTADRWTGMFEPCLSCQTRPDMLLRVTQLYRKRIESDGLGFGCGGVNGLFFSAPARLTSTPSTSCDGESIPVPVGSRKENEQNRRHGKTTTHLQEPDAGHFPPGNLLQGVFGASCLLALINIQHRTRACHPRLIHPPICVRSIKRRLFWRALGVLATPPLQPTPSMYGPSKIVTNIEMSRRPSLWKS